MVTYKEVYKKVQEIDKVICNACGKEIEKDGYGYLKDYLHVEKTWGYNSNKDEEVHKFDICEECYDNIIKSFLKDVK